MLWKVNKQTRHDLGRSKFIELVQDWKETYHQKINNAFRKMGCSLDWSREAFTMVRAVRFRRGYDSHVKLSILG